MSTEILKPDLPRRGFLRRSGGVAGASMLAGTLSACGGGSSETPVSDAALAEQMTAKLTAQLGDAQTASAIEPALMDVGFTWDLPTTSAAAIDTIVAYSFGNRPNAESGNTSSSGGNQAALPDPGPVNEALADTVHQILLRKPVPVFAQWEIARFLVSKYGLASSQLTSIEPVIAADGSITYLSTDGVAAAIVAMRGTAAALGTVAVVGHRDHAKRCIITSRGRGMNAFAVAEVPLPVGYDPESGQPWTRNRPLYLVHDMYAQMAVKSGTLTAQAYPQG